ncbi:hypothetical protein K456DRAFT_29026 [Colletotrichum gloeosporioides 23]|nr:hypothetical protein K456DRAFT_29026 [Colletotrichum gloeosporioides 23]
METSIAFTAVPCGTAQRRVEMVPVLATPNKLWVKSQGTTSGAGRSELHEDIVVMPLSPRIKHQRRTGRYREALNLPPDPEHSHTRAAIMYIQFNPIRPGRMACACGSGGGWITAQPSASNTRPTLTSGGIGTPAPALRASVCLRLVHVPVPEQFHSPPNSPSAINSLLSPSPRAAIIDGDSLRATSGQLDATTLPSSQARAAQRSPGASPLFFLSHPAD